MPPSQRAGAGRDEKLCVYASACAHLHTDSAAPKAAKDNKAKVKNLYICPCR